MPGVMLPRKETLPTAFDSVVHGLFALALTRVTDCVIEGVNGLMLCVNGLGQREKNVLQSKSLVNTNFKVHTHCQQSLVHVGTSFV